MDAKDRANRRTLLAATGSALLLGVSRVGRARAEGPGAKKTLADYGLVEIPNGNEKTYDKDKLDAPPAGFDEKNVRQVVPYDQVGGPIIFHGLLYVMADEADTFTDGKVSRGPAGGQFSGKYRLTKDYPDAYIYDDTIILKRHRHTASSGARPAFGIPRATGTSS
jgi:hypothetical protein